MTEWGFVQNRYVVDAVTLIVVTIWAAGMLVNIFNPSYSPPAGVQPALMVVLGAIFGARLIRRDFDDE